jgi:hypothetical protein
VINKSDASLDRDALILVNGTWYNMTDTSNGYFKSFFYPWDLSASTGPNKTITIMVFDNKTRSNTYVVNVTSDNEPPHCQFIAPLNNSYINQDVIIRVNASDDCSSISSASIVFKDPFGIASEPIDLQHIAGEWRYSWSCKSNLWFMGKYQVGLTVFDGAGNMNSSKIDVTLDYTNPVLEVLSPLNHSIISGIQDIKLRITDPISDISTISARFANGTSMVVINTSYQDCYTRLDTTKIQDGQISIFVNVTNHAGLINCTRLTYFIDNTLPNGAILGLAYIKNIANFTYVCNDSGSVTRIAWHLDQGLLRDLPITPQGVISISTKNFRDGLHILQVIVEDAASPVNRRTIEKQIIIDNTNPEVSVQNLYSGQLVSPQHEIQIRVYDANAVTLTFSLDYGAFREVQFDNLTGIWALSIPGMSLISGTHSIRLVGIDDSGNLDEDFYIFTVYYQPTLGEQVWAWFVKWAIIVIPAVALAIIIFSLWINRKRKTQKTNTKKKRTKR